MIKPGYCDAEKIVRSDLNHIAIQLIYANSGITLHLIEKETRFHPIRLYAYEPTIVDTFLRSAFSRVEIKRPLGPELA